MVGKFAARVTSNKLKKSKISGTPSVSFQFIVLFSLVDGSKASANSVVYDDLWLTPACIDRTLKTLSEVFGWEGSDLAELNDPIFSGMECVLVLEEEEYNGEYRTKVKFINRPAGGQRLSQDELDSILADVQPLLNNVRSPNLEDGCQTPAPPRGQANKPFVEEDLPF